MFIFLSSIEISIVSAKYLIGWRTWWIFGYFPGIKCIPMKIFFFDHNIHFELLKARTLNIPNNIKPILLFTVYSPKIFSMKNFDNDYYYYYYYPMEFACLWAQEMRMSNKLVGSWLMISISIELCDSVLKLVRNVIPFSIYCHTEYIVGCSKTPENAKNSIYLYGIRTRKYFHHIFFWTPKEWSKTFLFHSFVSRNVYYLFYNIPIFTSTSISHWQVMQFLEFVNFVCVCTSFEFSNAFEY